MSLLKEKLHELGTVMEKLADRAGEVMSNGDGEEEFAEAAWEAVNWWDDNGLNFRMAVRRAIEAEDRFQDVVATAEMHAQLRLAAEERVRELEKAVEASDAAPAT